MNSEQLCTLVVDALDDIKAKDIKTLDVRDMTTVTDYMIVASGTIRMPPWSEPLTIHAAA